MSAIAVETSVTDLLTTLPALVTSGDLSRALGPAGKTFIGQAKRGVFPRPLKFGSQWRWRRDDVIRHFRQLEADSRASSRPKRGQ